MRMEHSKLPGNLLFNRSSEGCDLLLLLFSRGVGADDSHDEPYIGGANPRSGVASKKAKGIIDMLECRHLHVEVSTLRMLLGRSRRRVIYIAKALQILLKPSLDLGHLL